MCVYVYIRICHRVRDGDGEGVSHFPREGGFAFEEKNNNKENTLDCNLSDNSVS